MVQLIIVRQATGSKFARQVLIAPRRTLGDRGGAPGAL